MEKENSDGLMVPYFQVYLIKGVKYWEGSFGLVATDIKVLFEWINLRDTESLVGRMVGFMRDNGKTTWWMVREYLFGKMGKILKGITKMIKSMGKEKWFYKMEQK